jgi:hypothetical protein
VYTTHPTQKSNNDSIKAQAIRMRATTILATGLMNDKTNAEIENRKPTLDAKSFGALSIRWPSKSKAFTVFLAKKLRGLFFNFEEKRLFKIESTPWDSLEFDR